MTSHKEKAVYVLANMHPKRQTAPVNKLLNKAIEKNFMKNSDHGFFSHTDLGGKRAITLFSARQDGLFDALFHDDELNGYRVYKSIEWDCVPEKRIYPFTRMPIPEITHKSQWYPIYMGEYIMSDDKYVVALNDFMTCLRNAGSVSDQVDHQLVKRIMFEGLFLHGDEPYNKAPHAVLDLGDAIVDVGLTSGGEVEVTYLDNDALLCKGYVPVMYNGGTHEQIEQERTTMTHQMLNDQQPVKERDEDVQVEDDLHLPAYTHSELMETISSTLNTFRIDGLDPLSVKQMATALADAVSNKGAELRWKNDTEEMFYRGMDNNMDKIHFIFRCLNEDTCIYYSRGMEELRDILVKHQYVAEFDGVFVEREGLILAAWSSNDLTISVYSNLRGVSPMVEFSVDGDVVDFNLWLLEAVEKEETFDLEPGDRYSRRRSPSRR